MGPVRLVDGDLIEGNGVSYLNLYKKPGEASGVDFDVSKDGNGVKIIPLGKILVTIDMADCIKLCTHPQTETTGYLVFTKATRTVVIRRFMYEQPCDVGETYFTTDMKTNLPDIVTDTRL